MRELTVICLLSSLVGTACGDCQETVRVEVRHSSAAIGLETQEAAWASQEPITYSTMLWGSEAQAMAPHDLVIAAQYPAGQTDATVASSPTRELGFRLTVRGVSIGPADIDLDDSNSAALGGFQSFPYGVVNGTSQHGISGHVRVTVFEQTCASPAYCFLAASGTFSFTALGLAGEVLTVMNGVFSAADRQEDQPVDCRCRFGDC